MQRPGLPEFRNEKAFGLTFNASYELDVWGLAQDNLRAANEQVKSTRFTQQAVALALNANVADQYLNVLALRQRIAIANQYIAAINNILDMIQLKVKAGSIDHLDLAREQAQLEFEEAQLPGLETQEKRALYTLAVLLGRPPEGFDVKAQNLDAVQSPQMGTGLPSELLLRRPDVAEAEANLAAAHANVDAARAAFLPQISLTGSGGFVSTAMALCCRAPTSAMAMAPACCRRFSTAASLRARRTWRTQPSRSSWRSIKVPPSMPMPMWKRR